MKHIIIFTSFLIFISLSYYLNHRFGLISLAGLNGKGLPTKEVKGNLASFQMVSAISIDHTEWTALLKKYVTEDGKVDYKEFLQDKNKLDSYLNALSKQVPTNNWSVQEQLAYYINLYNAQTVNLILRNYPLKSIKDISGPWTTDFIIIGKKELSLGALEHSILRKMNEPRIHFAINCASGSCPILLNEAYTAAKLDEQLNKVTRRFINSENNSITEKNLELSRIFKWYKTDFFDGDLIKYINQYSDVTVTPNAKIRFKEYDWNLNGQ